MSEHGTTVQNLLVLSPKTGSFERVAGLAVVQRTLLAARRVGFVRVVVWDFTPSPQLIELEREDRRLANLAVVAQLPLSSEVWAVVRSDWVFSQGVLNLLRQGSVQGVEVLAAGGQPVGAVGPGQLLLVALAAGGEEFWRQPLFRAAAVRVLDSAEVAIPITTRASIAHAEKALARKIWREAAQTDGFLAHWIDRRLSLRVSLQLARIPWLRPNHVTVFGTCLGLLAAYLFARGSYAAGLSGALLFWVACVLDGCDGEVARFTYRDSAWGKVFDVTTDNLVHAAIFLGIGLGSMRAQPAAIPVWLPGLLLGGLACAGAASYVFFQRRPALPPAHGNAAPGQWFENLLEGLMNRDFSYLLVLLALGNRLHWFLWGAAFGSYVVAVVALALVVRAKRQQAARAQRSARQGQKPQTCETSSCRNSTGRSLDPGMER